MNIKCLGCLELRRDAVNEKLTVYHCNARGGFPAVAIRSLLRPGKSLLKAVAGCPKDPLGHCVLCPKPPAIHMGQDILSICQEHYNAWSAWLDAHPDRRAHLAPKGRARKANWVEVFREFVEDIRRQK